MILGHFWQFWVFLDNFWQFWTVLDHLELILKIFNNFPTTALELILVNKNKKNTKNIKCPHTWSQKITKKFSVHNEIKERFLFTLVLYIWNTLYLSRFLKMSISCVLGNILEPSISAWGTQRHFFHVCRGIGEILTEKPKLQESARGARGARGARFVHCT